MVQIKSVLSFSRTLYKSMTTAPTNAAKNNAQTDDGMCPEDCGGATYRSVSHSWGLFCFGSDGNDGSAVNSVDNDKISQHFEK
mmetsp:Transcript_15391/g.23696  ORF Transcript_15391/g.23696 Transcript_15391/m.23696 type:complete len:83 (+) Transcript_15391:55-303(+)